MIDSPSGRALAKAPRWDLTYTEGYGGGNSFSWSLLMFSGYMGIYRTRSRSVDFRGTHEGGARAGHPRGRLACLLTSTPSPLDHVCSKKIAPEGFIPFELRLIFLFFKIQKIGKNK